MSRVLIVPPHGDFTLAWPEPEGFRVEDAARAFIERCRPLALEAEARRCEEFLRLESGDSAELARSVLLLRAAAAVLQSGRDVHRHLRACGAALAGLCPGRSWMRLTLDGLALVDGSTERGADVLAVARPEEGHAPEILDRVPYEVSLQPALRALGAAETVRLRLDTDAQLPAAVYLASHLDGQELELTGVYAAAHAGALARLPVFAGARLHAEDAVPQVVGSPLLPSAGSALRWVDDPLRLRIPRGGPWGGVVPFGALAEPQSLLNSGCQVAVLGFCELGGEVVGLDGRVLGRDAVRAAVDALRGAGVRVVGEWWIGAPGIGEAALERTFEGLERESPFDWLAGVRPFHWPARRESGRWGRVEVVAGPVPADRDLARERPFEAPGTLSPEVARERLETLEKALARSGGVSPGRVAQAYVTPPAPRPERGDHVCLEPECAVVTMEVLLDGRPGPASYAVNLKTGSILALEPPWAAALQALRAPALPGEALAHLPEAQREKRVRALVEKGVLLEVRA